MAKHMTAEEKINHVIDGIDQGKHVDQIAEEIGYKNYKSLDMFMRREGYTKERRSGNYLPKNGHGIILNQMAKSKVSVSSKALEIIKFFQKQEYSAKRIAHEAGFENAKEMAQYMKSKGFEWDPDEQNYTRRFGEQDGGGDVDVEMEPAEPEAEGRDRLETVQVKEREHAIPYEYLALLEYLDERKESLFELMDKKEVDDQATMPRYVVPGIFITKSIHISNQIDQMVRDFSADKNIPQREVFEIALIEFFRNHGFEKEVQTMLKRVE